jgi:hypothetical protein
LEREWFGIKKPDAFASGWETFGHFMVLQAKLQPIPTQVRNLPEAGDLTWF